MSVEKKFVSNPKLNLKKTVESTRFPGLKTTKDFPDIDPWFKWLADDIEEHPERFANRKYLEFGIGGGLQVIAALEGFKKKAYLPKILDITGIDIKGYKLNIAAWNLNQFSTPFTLYKEDAVQWIEGQREKIINTAIVMCLPQAPLEKAKPKKFRSSADTYSLDLLPKFAKKYNRWGLGLNAAVLGTLIQHVGEATDVSAVFSGRVPENVIRNMLSDLGWRVIDIAETPEPIQQDSDTDISYVKKYENKSLENLFFEKLLNGGFSPISAKEAENRLLAAKGKRDNLNVYHHVSVWHLEPQ